MKGPSLAVVGSGPAAFYTVMRAMQKIPSLQVDMFEKLATPFGLTRFGVAPDHPEVKNCQERFEEVAATNNYENFKFYGNCEVGRDVSLKELSSNFDAVLLAYGAQGERRLGIAGEQSFANVLSARQFVGWYNGEPQFQHLNMAAQLKRARTATIIGNGNVALDVARILLRDPKDLEQTDMTTQAIQQLKHNAVRHVQIVGRRGLIHSAFTNKELRELQNEPGTLMEPLIPVSQIEHSQKIEATLSRQDKRKLKLLMDIKARDLSETTTEQDTHLKTWRLVFLRRPLKFVGDPETGRMQGIEWQINEFDPNTGEIRPTDRTEFQATDLVFTSIGYKSSPINGMSDLGVEFDSKLGVVPRKRGQVIASGADNLFASGWVATGPVGVIAATMMDSFAVGEEIAQYLAKIQKYKPGIAGIRLPGKDQKRLVSWSDWLTIDKAEIERGQKLGKPRSKFVNTQDILDFLEKKDRRDATRSVQ